MNPFRRILFPYDFSEAASALAPAVSAMAQKFNATITVLHAFNRVRNYDLAPHLYESQWLEPAAVPYIPAIRTLREQDERHIKEFARTQLSSAGWTTIIEDGDPASVIEWAAKCEHSDLIMMSTRGLGRFRRMLPGSVTAKVLHDIEIPVFTSAHAPETLLATQHGFRKILCPLRMDADSETTLTMAGFLAQAFDARVCLLHVKMAGESQRQDASIQKILQFVGRALGPDVAADLDCSCRILNDSISDGIRKTAIEEGADLIVVGRGHAKARVSRVWTHLYTVIRESPCPVLSV